MSHPVEDTVTVELGDTDMARYVHFASVVRYFDVGLRNVLDAADLSFQDLFDRGLGLPIVNVSCEYTHPMRYGDQLTVQTRVASLSDHTVALSLRFQNEDGTVTANGTLTAAFLDIDKQQATPIPADIRASLAEVP